VLISYLLFLLLVKMMLVENEQSNFGLLSLPVGVHKAGLSIRWSLKDGQCPIKIYTNSNLRPSRGWLFEDLSILSFESTMPDPLTPLAAMDAG